MKLRFWARGDLRVADLGCFQIPNEELFVATVTDGHGLADGFQIVFCEESIPEPGGIICVLSVMRVEEPFSATTREILRGRKVVARERLRGWFAAWDFLRVVDWSKVMAETLLHDDAQTVARLDSIACLLEWVRSMPAPTRRRFWSALAECNDAVQQVVVTLVSVVKDPHTTPVEHQRALMTIADVLLPNLDEDEEYGQNLAASEIDAASRIPPLAREVQKMDTQEATFAYRLRELMEAKRISQQELADRVGCSQPAISQMLNRNCRPQKKTILKLTEALNVQAQYLWPDIDVAEMLDAVAGFQEDDYVMTDAEARALGDASRRNRPKIQAKSLPTRRR